MDDHDDPGKPGRTLFEEIEVTGSQLIDKIKDLIREGNVRRLRVRAGDGFTLDLPMTVGALAGGVVVLTAPWLAVIGVIAAMISQVKIEIEREVPAAPETPPVPEGETTETDRATDA